MDYFGAPMDKINTARCENDLVRYYAQLNRRHSLNSYRQIKTYAQNVEKLWAPVTPPSTNCRDSVGEVAGERSARERRKVRPPPRGWSVRNNVPS